MALDFASMQEMLRGMGFYDFVLPFLLAFAIVFGLLETIAVFAKGKNEKGGGGTTLKGVNAIVGIVIAFYVTTFTPYSTTLSSFFTNLFGGSIIALSSLLVIILLIGIIGFRPRELIGDNKILQLFVVGFLIIIGAIIFLNSVSIPGLTVGIPNWTDIASIIAVVAIIAIVIYFVTRPEQAQGQTRTPAPGHTV